MHWKLTEADRLLGRRSWVKPPPERERRLTELLAPPVETTPAVITPKLPTSTYWQLGGALAIIVGFAALALYAYWPTSQDAPRATQRPTATQLAPTAAPAVAPRAQPTATPAPPTATPEPPTPEPQIVVVQQQCYSVTQDVYSGSRPLGTVTGESCESQAAAQAAADALAAEMREGKP